jgi:hypothetical protein
MGLIFDFCTMIENDSRNTNIKIQIYVNHHYHRINYKPMTHELTWCWRGARRVVCHPTADGTVFTYRTEAEGAESRTVAGIK